MIVCIQKARSEFLKELTPGQLWEAVRGSSQGGKFADSHGRQQCVSSRVECII